MRKIPTLTFDEECSELAGQLHLFIAGCEYGCPGTYFEEGWIWQAAKGVARKAKYRVALSTYQD